MAAAATDCTRCDGERRTYVLVGETDESVQPCPACIDFPESTHMEPSFDSAGDTARHPAAPPRSPAAGVADIDDAGTTNTIHPGGPR